MIVAFSIHDGRISPVLDVARRFLLLQLHPDGLSHREVGLDSSDPVSKTKRLAEWGVRLVVCGAISWPLQAMLTAAGIQVIANTCGPVAEVEAAYLAGGLGGRAFLMPGCPGRQRRGRQRRRRGRGGWNR